MTDWKTQAQERLQKKLGKRLQQVEERQATARLDSEVAKWIEVLKKSLVSVENRIRQHQGLTPLPSNTFVMIPTNLKLFNLSVWSIRYWVSPEFILQILFDYYKKRRKRPLKVTAWSKRKGFAGILSLGLPVDTLCSKRNRQIIEEAVMTMYPGGENVKAGKQEFYDRYWRATSKPPRAIDYKTHDEMLEQYAEMIESYRKRTSVKPNLRPCVFGVHATPGLITIK